MGATSAILSGGNAVNSFIGSQQQARAIVSQAGFDSQLANLNARDAIARGQFSVGQREIQTNRTIGAQRAAQAASGIDANAGSAVDLQSDEAKYGALDEQMIRNNATREAWGYTTQAALNSLAARNEAQNIQDRSYGTLLTDAVNTYGIYSKTRNKNTLTTDPHTMVGSAGGARVPTPYASDVAKLGPRTRDRTTRY